MSASQAKKTHLKRGSNRSRSSCLQLKITCQTESLDVFPLTGQIPVLLNQSDFVNFEVSAQVNYIYFEQIPKLKD